MAGSADVQGFEGRGVRARLFRRRGEEPLILRFAELFLMFIISIYIAKICLLAFGMYLGYGLHRTSLLMFVVDIAMMFLTTDSLLAITSRRPKAWKKVTRASILLIVFNLASWLGIMGSTAASLVVFNPAVVTPPSLAVLIMMYLPSVRRYYTPIMEEERPLWAWFRYSWFWPLYTADRYRVVYDDERQGVDGAVEGRPAHPRSSRRRGGESVSRTFPADAAMMHDVQDFVRGFMQDVGASERAAMQMELVAEEVFTNIAHYSHGTPGEGTVEVTCSAMGTAAVVRFSDDGSEFDPLSMGEPDVEAPMEVRGMGGLGIYLVRRNVDDIVYSREGGRNVLTLVKDLS